MQLDFGVRMGPGIFCIVWPQAGSSTNSCHQEQHYTHTKGTFSTLCTPVLMLPLGMEADQGEDDEDSTLPPSEHAGFLMQLDPQAPVGDARTRLS